MPQIRVLLQCRLSSSRLPAKGLLPLAGTSVVALAAKRAANRGLPVTVVTSTDPSDDILERHLGREGVPVFRGPLDDVLGRFDLACRDLPDDALVFRITADDVVPDGAFLERVLAELRAQQLEYMGAWAPVDGVPQGLSAELFPARVLREAAREAKSALDREHVTPWMIRHYGGNHFKTPWLATDYSHLRMTIDTLPDYVRMARLFEGEKRPIDVPAEALCEKLSRQAGEPAFRVPFRVYRGVHGALALGTSRLADLRRAAPRALAHGVTFFVTSPAHGSAESELGAALAGGLASQATVATSLSPSALSAGPREAGHAVMASLLRSCHALRLRALPLLVLPSKASPAVREAVLAARAEGLVQRLGVSAESAGEAVDALAGAEITYVSLRVDPTTARLPADVAAMLERRPDVTFHARGTPADPSAWLRYLKAQPWFMSALIEPDTPAALDEWLERSREKALSPTECARLEGTKAAVSSGKT